LFLEGGEILDRNHVEYDEEKEDEYLLGSGLDLRAWKVVIDQNDVLKLIKTGERRDLVEERIPNLEQDNEEMKQDQEEMKQDQEEMKQDQEEIKEQLDQVSEGVFEREQQTRGQVVNNLIRIERLENPPMKNQEDEEDRIAQLDWENDQEVMRQDQEEMRQDQEEMKQDQEETRQDQEEMRQDQEEMRQRSRSDEAISRRNERAIESSFRKTF